MSRFKEILKETLIEQQLDEGKLATVVQGAKLVGKGLSLIGKANSIVQGAIVVKKAIDNKIESQKEKDS